MENGTFAEALAQDQELIVQALGRKQAIGGLTEDQLQDIKRKLQRALNFPADAQMMLDFDRIEGRGIFKNYRYSAPDGTLGCREIRGQLEIGSKRVQFIYRIETGELEINDVSATRQQVSQQIQECLEKTHMKVFCEAITNDDTRIKIEHMEYNNPDSGAVLNLHVLIIINGQSAEITRTDTRTNTPGKPNKVYSVKVGAQGYTIGIFPGGCRLRKHLSQEEADLPLAELEALEALNRENTGIKEYIVKPG